MVDQREVCTHGWPEPPEVDLPSVLGTLPDVRVLRGGKESPGHRGIRSGKRSIMQSICISNVS